MPRKRSLFASGTFRGGQSQIWSPPVRLWGWDLEKLYFDLLQLRSRKCETTFRWKEGLPVKLKTDLSKCRDHQTVALKWLEKWLGESEPCQPVWFVRLSSSRPVDEKSDNVGFKKKNIYVYFITNTCRWNCTEMDTELNILFFPFPSKDSLW